MSTSPARNSMNIQLTKEIATIDDNTSKLSGSSSRNLNITNTSFNSHHARAKKLSSREYFKTLNHPFMEVQMKESSLVDNYAPRGNSGRKNVINLKLTDPLTKRTLCNIREPKLKIGRYTRGGDKCIDLHSFMKDLNVTPDFGFDAKDSIVAKESRDPWSNMLALLGNKQKQKALWNSVDDMSEIKKNYNTIVAQKQKAVPKQLKNREEIKKLFEDYTLPDNSNVFLF